MTRIALSEPEGPYGCVIDSGAMEVELRDVFLGVTFVTKSGERLAVSMRDGGFELAYTPDENDDITRRKLELKQGVVTYERAEMTDV